jgi:hypothetical protein
MDENALMHMITDSGEAGADPAEHIQISTDWHQANMVSDRKES